MVTKEARRRSLLSRRKGAKEELDVRDALRAIDPQAARVPLSGQGGGRFAGDVHFDVGGNGTKDTWVVECKLRKSGFAQIHSWMGANEILTVRANNSSRLWIVQEETMIALLSALKRQNERGVDDTHDNGMPMR